MFNLNLFLIFSVVGLKNGPKTPIDFRYFEGVGLVLSAIFWPKIDSPQNFRY